MEASIRSYAERVSVSGPPSLQYDEFCDLLGGSGWDQAVEQWTLSGLTPQRRQDLPILKSRFSSSNQFFFSGDREVFPLEVLWLKWNLFIALCRRIEALHKVSQRPLLDIQPSCVEVTLPDYSGDCLPVRGVFSVDVPELKGASPFSHAAMPADLASRLFLPPSDLAQIYSAPLLLQGPLGKEESVTVLIRSMERIRGSQDAPVRGIMQVFLTSDSIHPSDYSLKDVFRVSLRLQEEDASSVQIWAGKTVSSERGLLLDGVTEPLSPGIWEGLEKARQKVFSRSGVATFKSCHVPCDLFSLGMIALRSLLVNADRDMSGVEPGVKRTIERMALMAQDLDSLDRKALSRRVRAKLREEGDLFSKNAVLFRREDREKGGESIPDEIWYEALIVAFRLVTWLPGFGYCRDHGDFDPARPEALMETVIADAEILEERIRGELFGCRQRNREVLEACDRVRNELVKGAKA